MNEKLKKLAKKMEGLLSEVTSPQETLDKLIPIIFQQKEYFNHFSASDKIKLIFYIFSLKDTGSFELADKILDNLIFVHMLTSEGNYYVETCDSCGGNGAVHCVECNGSGEVACGECRGSGNEPCTYCHGDGLIDGENCDNCGGTGDITCSNCGGGEVDSCEYCGGDGEAYCSECEGNGENITDELEYLIYYICTWNKQIKDICELTENTSDPAMSEFDFDRLRNEYVILSIEDGHAIFDSIFEENKMYCIGYSDDPQLYEINNMYITDKLYYRNRIPEILLR